MKFRMGLVQSAWVLAVLLGGCDRQDPASGAGQRKASNRHQSERISRVPHPRQPARSAPADDPLLSKQRYPKLRLTPDGRSHSAQFLQQEIGNVDPAGPNFAKKISEKWSEIVASLPDTRLDGSSDADVATGRKLPEEISGRKGTAQRDAASFHSQEVLSLLAAAAAQSGAGLLPQLAGRRADHLPPTSRDIAVYSALLVGIDELRTDTGASFFEDWEPLGNSANPVYRLLALKAAMRTPSRAASGMSPEDPRTAAVDGPAKLPFYLTFLVESDPVILETALRAVATVPTPEARRAIEKFLAAQLDAGNTELAGSAARALRSSEVISQSGR